MTRYSSSRGEPRLIMPELADLLPLLRRRADDAAVGALIGRYGGAIERFEYVGFVELVDAGVSVMFAEAPHVLPWADVGDPKALHVSAFHFHGPGHEQHAPYTGELPGGLRFGDGEGDVVAKMGEPIAIGGGGWSSVLSEMAPFWMRYALGDGVTVEFQMDPAKRVEMVTLAVPDPLTPR